MSVKQDIITQIEIDESGKLHIKPQVEIFSLIYRTATEVHWDDIKQTLYSLKPREWNYLEWFVHITAVARNECSIELKVTEKTKWINIPDDLKNEITKAQQCI
tara:strand:- start:88 stop:396 length:309 start_codon:yes stop_codon:yes gene_type:complete